MSYDLQNFYKATLSLDWSIGTGTFYVSTKPTISTGWLVVSPNNSTLREIIKYTSTGTDSNGDFIVVSVRGVGGTTEQTHVVGEPIRMNITAEYWDAMNDDITAIVASGVSNANTTTMGGVEEATAAEIDAGTQTGSTGAELFINPKLLNDAHNIPFVAPGTSGNLMSSNGTDWTAVALSTLLPLPAFQQDLCLSVNDSLSAPEFAAGSMTDGSAFFVRLQGSLKLYRFGRDAITGQYSETHAINPTLSIPGTDVGAIINIGNYIYLFSNDGTNIVCSRFLAADLTGEQVMTVPTVGCTNQVAAWTDGTYAYVVSAGSGTTARKWSLSGTTFSAVSTATTSLTLGTHVSSMWNGTNAYIVFNDNSGTGPITVQKLTNIDGSSFTSSSTTIGAHSDTMYGAITASIDSSRIYIGFFYAYYNPTVAASARIKLIPITKP
jgi:hypothetical protein